MKNPIKVFFTVLILLGAATGWTEDRKESDNPEAMKYFDSGARKDQQNDSQSALKDYSKAIELDPKFADAYYLRGRLERTLKDYDAALKDLTQAISFKKDELFYYERAQTYMSLEKYPQAIPDLDFVIKTDPDFSDALICRGRLKAATGDPDGGCKDLKWAQKRGDHRADEMIPVICYDKNHKGEQLVIDWPDSENWKVASRQTDGNMVLVELTRGKETLDNWTELGSVLVNTADLKVTVRQVMEGIQQEALKADKNSRFTFLEENNKGPYPWIIFTLENTPGGGGKTESDLYYVAKGKQSLFICFRALHKNKLDAATIKKWTAFFKTAEIKE